MAITSNNIPRNPTIEELIADYQSYLQAMSSAINAYAPNTFWHIDAGAMAAIFLDLYMNLQIVQNSIYPQYSSGDQVDQWLYSRGLPARLGATYGTIQCTIPSGTYPITVAINTQFTQANMTYQTLQAYVIPNNITKLTLYNTNIGLQQTPAINSTLTSSSSITVQVQSVNGGSNAELDQSCINRILQAILIPPGGARQTDYFNFCLLGSPTTVTDVIILPAFMTINSVKILGVFPLIGSKITDYQLDQGLINATSNFYAYTRTPDSTTTTNVNTYIQNQKLVGLTVSVGTCNTYTIDNALTSGFICTISLLAPYGLTSTITALSTDSTGTSITQTYTILQLIKREIRRAICNQAYGATIINGVNYITVDSLITVLNTQLSASSGAIAQLITNVTFNFTDIVVPSYTLLAVQNIINYIYDIPAYSSSSPTTTGYAYIQVNVV